MFKLTHGNQLYIEDNIKMVDEHLERINSHKIQRILRCVNSEIFDTRIFTWVLRKRQETLLIKYTKLDRECLPNYQNCEINLCCILFE